MKSKISVTMDPSLLEFLDSLAGESRSEKIAGAVRTIQKMAQERDLRMQLAGCREDDAERMERELWESTIAEAMWAE